LEGYRYHEGLVPSNYSPAFEESLFNTQEHRTLQQRDGWHSFYILNEANKKICGAIHFRIADRIAHSPYSAPFGSLEFNPTVPKQIINEFLQFVENQMMKHHVSSIMIKSYPEAYQKDNALLLQACLLKLNYKIINNEIDSVIDVREKGVGHLFNRSHGRLLKKANQEGLYVKQIDLKDLKDVYYFIDQCRREKGYVLSMNFDQVKKTTDLLAEHFKIFGVYKENKLTAASITVRVNEGILYDFYHDHDSAFDDVSPIVTLVAGLYEYCFEHSIQLLDLGTSSLNGKPNAGLLEFKNRLGGRPTPKVTFSKTLRQ
jgi:hypothetical protein